MYATDTELVDLIPLVGEAHAVRSYRLGLEAIDKLEQLVRRLGDDCGFERKQSLYLASKRGHVPKLRREYEQRLRSGFEVEYLDKHAVEARFPFRAPAAILTAGDGQIDALRLTHLLLKRASEQGLRVYDRCSVAEVKSGKDRVSLRTEHDCTVRARRVVFATGYESQQHLEQEVGQLDSTFALVTEPLEPFPAWPERCLIWETARHYFYLRTTAENRVIIGGGDAPYVTEHRQESLRKHNVRKLHRRLQRMFPDTDFEVAYTWAGTFGSTRDGLAYIGQTSEWRNAYFALGYGANGITMAMIAAEIITDHFLGRHNDDAMIFRFDRHTDRS